MIYRCWITVNTEIEKNNLLFAEKLWNFGEDFSEKCFLGTERKNFTPFWKYSQEDVRWRKRNNRDIQQKWLVYHTAWCLDKEIPSFGKRALDKTRLLFFLSFLPGVIAIPIHLWVMRTAGKPSRSLKPLTQKWKKGQSGLSLSLT